MLNLLRAIGEGIRFYKRERDTPIKIAERYLPGAAREEIADAIEYIRVGWKIPAVCNNAATRGLFGRAAFAAMKRGALFLSTARGGIHDEQALFDALASGRLGGAGLDVWSIEPPPPDHPLLSLDNVLATYHIAGVTHGARRGMARMAAGQILGVATGRQPHNLVNPSVIPALAARHERVLGRRLRWGPGSTE